MTLKAWLSFFDTFSADRCFCRFPADQFRGDVDLHLVDDACLQCGKFKVAPPSKRMLSMPRSPENFHQRLQIGPAILGRYSQKLDAGCFEQCGFIAVRPFCRCDKSLGHILILEHFCFQRDAQGAVDDDPQRIFPPGMREVSCGSSMMTVWTPTMMPVRALRSWCTRPLAAGPVIHCDSPVRDAILSVQGHRCFHDDEPALRYSL